MATNQLRQIKGMAIEIKSLNRALQKALDEAWDNYVYARPYRRLFDNKADWQAQKLIEWKSKD